MPRARASSSVALALGLILVGHVSLPVPIAVSWAAPSSPDPFVENRGGATIDWRRGIIEATGGAAADHRMPSADTARPGAERRAQAAARARLAEVLRTLPLGGGRHLDDAAVLRAVGRASQADLELQSNGGALVRMTISFGDWATDAGAAASGGPGPGPQSPDRSPTQPSGGSVDRDVLVLAMSEGRLAAAPVVVVAGKEISLGSARYAPDSGIPPGLKPRAAHADRKGRLVLDNDGGRSELAGRAAMIYVHKILR